MKFVKWPVLVTQSLFVSYYPLESNSGLKKVQCYIGAVGKKGLISVNLLLKKL